MVGQPHTAEPLTGLAQASQVFLGGCGLPAAWAGQRQWRVLETGFGRGLNFLVTWQAWRDDPNRPSLLHYVATETQVVSKAELLRPPCDQLAPTPLAHELAAQWNGLLPGTHRLTFEGGRVTLTLGVGDAPAWLKAQHVTADSVYLHSWSQQHAPAIWRAHALKTLARSCRRGARLASDLVDRQLLDGLAQYGFGVSMASAGVPERNNLQAVFNPPWEPRKKADPAWPQPRQAQRCLVIGAGLAGAATAASLARRGWAVTVLDAKPAPAGGASSLPAGFLAPHVSPDDGVLSRLSRSGLRATWHAVAELLGHGDSQAKGVLQRRFDTSARLPADWPDAGAHWTREAGAADLQNADFGRAEFAGDAQAPLWHAAGGWVKPARLVTALLNTSGVTCLCGQQVATLKRLGADDAPVWQALDKAGRCMAQAELVVVAAGPASAELVTGLSLRAPLLAVRGQVLWGAWPQTFASAMPASPVNGLGGLIPMFPSTTDGESQPHWLLGATFERGESQPLIRTEDTRQLQDRLVQLWPAAAKALAPQIAAGQTQTWAGVRCGSPDRLPLVGPLDEAAAPGLWLCTAMGSRGLTFAVLCGELLGAWVNDEPLPLEKRLAQQLLASRFNPT